MTRATLFAILICATSAAADSKLQMRWLSNDNIHLADHEGAINRNSESNVTVELLAKGKSRVVDTGSRSEHNLYPTFSTDEQTAWTNKWTGTWAIAKDALKLELALADRTCTKSKTETGVAAQPERCDDVTKQIELGCTSEVVSVTVGDKSRTQPVWHCSPVNAAELADTPSIWIFAKTGACLKIGADRMGRASLYEPC